MLKVDHVLRMAILPVFFVAQPLQSLPRAPKIYVSGVVLAGGSRRPIAGASIQLSPGHGSAAALTTRSLVNGAFLLTVPYAGSWRLNVDAGPDYNLSEMLLHVPPAGLSSLRITPSPCAALRLKLQAAGGMPINGEVQVFVIAIPQDEPGAPRSFWLNGEATGRWVTAAPAADGSLSIAMPRGFKTAGVSQVGIAVRSAALGVGFKYMDGWPHGPVPVYLKTAAVLKGEVFDAPGRPAANAYVVVVGMDANIPRRFLQGFQSIWTDRNGHFEVPALAPGRYAVGASIGMGQELCRFVTVTAPAADVRIDPENDTGAVLDAHLFAQTPAHPLISSFGLLRQRLEVAPGVPAEVTGRVIDSVSHAAISGAHVRLNFFTPGVSTLADAVLSRADGSYRLQAPAAGTYTIDVSRDGYGPLNRALDVPADGLHALDLEMTVQRMLQITFLRPDGGALSNARPQIWYASAHSGAGFEPQIPPDGILRLPLPTNASDIKDVVIGARADGIGCTQVLYNHGWPLGPLTIRLAPGATVSGVVTDEHHHPVGGATVTASSLFYNRAGLRDYLFGPDGHFAPNPPGPIHMSYSLEGLVKATTDAAGHFAIHNLVYGKYQLRVRLPGTGFRYRTVTLNSPETTILLTPADNPVSLAAYPGPE